jgi:hypothetical protein
MGYGAREGMGRKKLVETLSKSKVSECLGKISNRLVEIGRKLDVGDRRGKKLNESIFHSINENQKFTSNKQISIILE